MPSSLKSTNSWFGIHNNNVKVTQSCPTLCNPMGYTLHGILQARIPEWIAVPFSRGSSQPRSPTLQADSLLSEPPGKPKSTGMDSLSLPSLGNLPKPRIEPRSPALQEDSLPAEPQGKPAVTMRPSPKTLLICGLSS